MTFDQLFAGYVALILFLGLGITAIRARNRLSFVATLVLVFLIPATGLAYYAVVGGPVTYQSPLLWAAVVLVVAAAPLAIWSGRLLRAVRARPITSRTLVVQPRVALAARTLIIVAFTALLALWEPWFAVANLAVNGAWMLAWIPARYRTGVAEHSVDVAAPPEDVWAMLADPTRRPPRDDDVEEIVVTPPGPLRPGTSITTRRRLSVMTPRRGAVMARIEMHAHITEVVPGASYTAADPERNVTTTWAVAPGGAGSRVVVTSRFGLSIVQGIAGVGLMLPWMLGEYEKSSQKSLDRLRDALEAPTGS